MANLKEIKRRIGSVESTRKITNAMKLVSAAKFARANHAVENSRPYAKSFAKMVATLVSDDSQSFDSVLLKQRPEKKVLVVAFSTDRGLCGALNSNIFKQLTSIVDEKVDQGIEVDLVAYGRRVISFTKKMDQKVVESAEKVLEKPTIELARAISGKLSQRFIDGEYDAIYAVYPRYKSALEQVPVEEKLLPIDIDVSEGAESGVVQDLIVEPDLSKFIDSLLEKRVVGGVFNILLNGSASEHGARMTAMDSATSNAKEVIRKLTLEYNRARQAAITTELTEIISGAEAIS
jgi:F-type H+-transporting ATPase subunit gamma